MTTESISNTQELDDWIEREGIRYFKIGIFDIDGVMRGKYVNREKLRSAVDKGFGFCDVIFGWDSHDELYDRGVEVSGWHTGYRDAYVRLDLSTLRRIPFEEDTLLLIGSFQGTYADVCPRTILARTIEKAASMGFGVDAAFEYEFFLFDETPESIREKGYRDLDHFSPGMFGYSVIRNSVHAEFYHDLLDSMEEFDCSIETLHTETGPGVIEAAIRYARLPGPERPSPHFALRSRNGPERLLRRSRIGRHERNNAPFCGGPGSLHARIARDGLFDDQ